MDSELYKKTLFTIIFLSLIMVSFLIIKPFLTALLTGLVFSYLFYPLYRYLKKKLKRKNLASLITTLLVVLIVTLPLFFVLDKISTETYTNYILSKQKLSTIGVYAAQCEPADKFSCKIMDYMDGLSKNPQLKYYVDTTVSGVTTKVTDGISNILFSIPVFILHLFIFLFVLFFLFRDGKLLINKVERVLPLKREHSKKVFEKLNEMTYAVIYGSIIIAIIQGTLGGIGFFIFGIPTPLLWGIVMSFAALIPYIGSSIIWLPASLFLIFNGYADFDTALIIKGILLIFYGIFIVGTIDNILKPKIIGERGGLHPVVVLLGVVGGLKLIGFIGVLVGPIILAILVTFIKIYEEEKS